MLKALESRKPSEAPRGRMGKLARLPVFYALEGKRTLVAAEGAGAVWKIELLSAAGARVDVYAPKAGADLLALSQEAPGGEITLHARSWQAEDFPGAAIAVGTFKSDAECERFALAVRAAGVPVNVIDKPAFCDFAFGSIVNRSPLVIGISTDGAAPVFGQAIRAKIEAILPAGFAFWAEAARRWRGIMQSGENLSFAARRRFWQIFTAHALAEPAHVPGEHDYRKIMSKLREEGASAEQGSVTLVGAGPGDPELLTLRAVRALQSADLILFDDLVSDGILDFARREAKKISVGKIGDGASCKQADINALMLSSAAKGKRVVRLKGGDTAIFARAGEEIEACNAAGIAVEIVPGVTAASAAAAALKQSLSHRDFGRRVQFVTARGKNGALPEDLDLAALADPAATTCIYMGGETAPELARALLAKSAPADLPVAILRNVSRAGQTIERLDLLQLASRKIGAGGGPVLVVIGYAIGERSAQPGGIEEAA